MTIDLDERLSRAFDAWSRARDELHKLRAGLPRIAGRQQLAQGPEAAGLFRQVADQERQCEVLFHELLAVAEERAAHLQQLPKPRPADRRPDGSGDREA
ncbi:MAG TPA: hypothetical protein VFE82_15365 [Ramlibacter sp.]|jgi:hypothetical protein|uniref:hypothetical protein n=1 Tax=Ramlibacter sp. TaxID=1917967 RepID=UPI002D553988|nr:hypothetical protein [Ramlibacter sp.]HZY19852.1 hypothetical protein [Ramlibacter sp.]